MTIKEFIKILKRFPQKAIVISVTPSVLKFQDSDGSMFQIRLDNKIEQDALETKGSKSE